MVTPQEAAETVREGILVPRGFVANHPALAALDTLIKTIEDLTAATMHDRKAAKYWDARDKQLRAERDRLAEALLAWVRHYEQTAPDDANPSDPEWALWQNARTALNKGDEQSL